MVTSAKIRPATAMTEESPDPLLRLSEAIDAWIARDNDQPVEDFLAENDELQDLLEPMFSEDGPQGQVADASVPRMIGDYKLVRELGRGGMGVVYEALQVSLRRRVALKVLAPRRANDPLLLERFRREAAAVARLKHPGILPIFEVGQAGEIHYFAMELIDGSTLADRMEDLRTQSPSISRGFAGLELGLPGAYPTQVAEIAASVSEALAAAHAAGVIHRDVTPRNVLIGDDEAVRVVDFGLARDSSCETISHGSDVLGTPNYMSPEQVKGMRHVDARSDVYGVGVLLYEMLTLHRPFEEDSHQALLLAIGSDDPRPILRLSPRTPRDLRVLCERAMEKDPRHRIGSAAELARDLRRFLAHETIHAQPSGLVRRASKWMRRHRATAAALGALVIASVVWFAIHVRDLDLRNAAEARNNTNLATIHTHLRDQIEKARILSEQPGMDEVSRSMAETALATLQRIEETGERFPAHRGLFGWAHTELARTHYRLRTLSSAEEHALAARVWFEGLVRDFPGDDAHGLGLADAQRTLGKIRFILGRAEEASRDLEDALETYRSNKDSGLRTTLGIVAATQTLCSLRLAEERPSERCAPDLQATLDLLGSLPEEHRGELSVVDARFRCQLLLAQANIVDRRWGPAGDHTAQAAAIWEQLKASRPELGRSRRRLVTMLCAQAECHGAARRWADAEAAMRRAVEGSERLVEEYPLTYTYRQQLARCLRGLATYIVQLPENPKLEEAEQCLGRAVSLLTKDGDANPNPNERPNRLVAGLLAHCHADLLQVQLVAGQPLSRLPEPQMAALDRALDKARSWNLEVVKHWPSAWAHHRLGRVLHNEGVLRLRTGRYADAARAGGEASKAAADSLEIQPKQGRFRVALRNSLLLLTEAGAFARLPKVAEDANRRLVQLGNPNQQTRFMIARTFARCASLIPRGEAGYEGNFESAFDHIRQAIAAGVDRRRFLAEPSFKTLRRDPRWAELVSGGEK